MVSLALGLFVGICRAEWRSAVASFASRFFTVRNGTPLPKHLLKSKPHDAIKAMDLAWCEVPQVNEYRKGKHRRKEEDKRAG
jgi:excinuclease UvrABC helicase subunit UvrB